MLDGLGPWRSAGSFHANDNLLDGHSKIQFQLLLDSVTEHRAVHVCC
jgi:hypothetical protein